MDFMKWFRNKPTQEVQQKQTPYINYVISGLTQKHAGVEVNFDSAMRQADVYTCVKILAESISTIPLKVYRYDSNGVKTEVERGNRYKKILCDNPNDYMTSQELVEYLVTALMLRGNAFLHIVENTRGNMMELIPLKYFNAVNLEMDGTSGIPYATWTTNDSQTLTSYAPLYKDSLFHVKLQSVDGFRGISPIYQMAEHLGVAIAEKRHTAKTFENGARLSGVLSTDEVLDNEAAERLGQSWNAAYGGAENVGKVAVLEHGLKYQGVTMNNSDAQLLELMQFSREQIAAIYKIPVHMLNDTSASTYNNVEQNNLQFLKHTLMPIMRRIENNFNHLLPDNMCVSFDTTQFSRGDIETQSKYAETMIKNGVWSWEDARKYFDMSPEITDERFVIESNNYVWGTWDELGERKQMELEQQTLAMEGTRISNEVAANPPQSTQSNSGEDNETTQ